MGGPFFFGASLFLGFIEGVDQGGGGCVTLKIGNAINAALHATDITDPGEGFPQQPSVYLIAGDEPGTFVAAFRPLGDVLHIGRPKIDKPLPDSVQKMADFMHIIEEWRDPCVRDGEPVTPEVIAAVDGAYADLMATAEGAIPGMKG